MQTSQTRTRLPMIWCKRVAGLAMALLLIGCHDILDTEPPDSINSSNFFATKDDAIAAINGAYQPLQWPKLYNLRMWTSDIIAGNSVVGAGGRDGRHRDEGARRVRGFELESRRAGSVAWAVARHPAREPGAGERASHDARRRAEEQDP